jgi:hypothetical protein
MDVFTNMSSLFSWIYPWSSKTARPRPEHDDGDRRPAKRQKPATAPAPTISMMDKYPVPDLTFGVELEFDFAVKKALHKAFEAAGDGLTSEGKLTPEAEGLEEGFFDGDRWITSHEIKDEEGENEGEVEAKTSGEGAIGEKKSSSKGSDTSHLSIVFEEDPDDTNHLQDAGSQGSNTSHTSLVFGDHPTTLTNLAITQAMRLAIHCLWKVCIPFSATYAHYSATSFHIRHRHRRHHRLLLQSFGLKQRNKPVPSSGT